VGEFFEEVEDFEVVEEMNAYDIIQYHIERMPMTNHLEQIKNAVEDMNSKLEELETYKAKAEKEKTQISTAFERGF